MDQHNSIYREIAIEACLVVLLGAYGLTARQIQVHEARRDTAHGNANLALELGHYTAFTIDGRRISPFTLPHSRGVVTFLLRFRSLKKDLATWQQIANLMPAGARVELVGFCDDLRCGEVIRTYGETLRFSVALYGEVVDMQAILNADTLGQALVQTDETSPIAVMWRAPGRTPEDIARMILQ
jgi:hypothetical protein